MTIQEIMPCCLKKQKIFSTYQLYLSDIYDSVMIILLSAFNKEFNQQKPTNEQNNKITKKGEQKDKDNGQKQPPEVFCKKRCS